MKMFVIFCVGLLILNESVYLTYARKFKITAQFREEFLNAMNSYRAKHGSPPVKWDSAAETYAQKHADALKETGHVEDSKPKQRVYGETIYYSHPSAKKGNIPVDSWYSGVKNYRSYDFPPRPSSEIGSFTQMVWKATEKVGLGVAVDDRNQMWIVCEYYPIGNWVGQYQNNVLKPQW